jgi:glycosyltransferase involved in cell wall biosynthesis
LIYVCIPAHNEGRTIGVLLWKIRKVMLKFGREYEVLILDDASTDETHAVLERYLKVLPVRVLREERRVGYARAVELLLRAALRRTSYPKRDVAVVLQGDFTENPEHIVPLVKALEGGADVVAGSIVENGHAVPRPVRVARWMAPLFLGKAHAGAPVSDPLCGFRAYRLIVLKKALRDLPDGPLLSKDSWVANFELLGIVAPYARRIAEAPLDLRYDIRRRPSRFRPVRTLRGLLRVRREKWEGLERRKTD